MKYPIAVEGGGMDLHDDSDMLVSPSFSMIVAISVLTFSANSQAPMVTSNTKTRLKWTCLTETRAARPILVVVQVRAGVSLAKSCDG